MKIKFNNIYKYCITKGEQFELQLPDINLTKNICIEHNGNKLAEITTTGKLIAYAGFCWDGCSPKVQINGKILGTYDGPNDELRYASLTHDIITQLINEGKLDKSYRYANVIFLTQMVHVQWVLSTSYYLAVSLWFNVKTNSLKLINLIRG